MHPLILLYRILVPQQRNLSVSAVASRAVVDLLGVKLLVRLYINLWVRILFLGFEDCRKIAN